ncbi:hypothetical protein [Gelidibacter salicanalis]|uniref:Uncharacterized protein n=1 Tax=Gelidibacter salicanalis TaxID=291193 RepID=A0A934NCI5_9FLAO|nr:hypothetical protein [Gelidibacter salicanalis]MBJ7880740.1 hypothetical protein [Gelidibacter salicanalis]
MTDNNTELSDREYERLKHLVESGRKYHYRNFVFAILVLVLLLKDESESLKLVLDVELPVKILMVVLYFLTIIYTVITIDIFSSTYKTILNNFDGEVPFNWFVLTGKLTRLLSGFLLVLPLIICYIGIALSKIPIDKIPLFYLGLFGTFLPGYLKDFAYNVSRKEDSNGKKITLSIYLLFWYRLIRNIFFIIFFITPVFYYFNHMEKPLSFSEIWEDNMFILIVFAVLWIMRILGDLFHKKINKIGVKFGFEKEYKK